MGTIADETMAMAVAVHDTIIVLCPKWEELAMVLTQLSRV